MANYATLKAAVQAVITTNGNNEITGAILQDCLLSLINSLGAQYQFVGVASPSTNPGTPDYNVAYLAGSAGTYANFGGVVVVGNELAILKYNGTWSKETIADLTVFYNIEPNDEYNAVRLEDGGNINLIPGYYDATGISVGATFVPSQKYTNSETTKCAILYCEGNEVFAVSLRGNTAARRRYILLDGDDNVLSYSTTSGKVTGYLVTPVQCRKIIINNIIDESDSPYFRKISATADNQLLNELLYNAGYGELLPFVLQGVFFDIRSNISSTSQKCTFTPVENVLYRTALIPCQAGDKFFVNVLGTTASARAWFFLDANDIILSYATAAEYHEVLNAPAGAVRLILIDKGWKSDRARYQSFRGESQPTYKLTLALLDAATRVDSWQKEFSSNNAKNNLLDSIRRTIVPSALETYNAYYRAAQARNFHASSTRLTYFPEIFVKGGGTLKITYSGLNGLSIYELPYIPLGTNPIDCIATRNIIAIQTCVNNQDSGYTGVETLTLNAATQRIAIVMGATQDVATVPDDILNNITSIEVDCLDEGSLKPYETTEAIPAGAVQFSYDSPKVTTYRGGYIRRASQQWGDIGTSANYGKYAVGITKGEGTFYLYNLETLTKLCEYSQTEKDSNIWHANCATFVNVKYSESDYFPLLYVSVRKNADPTNHPNQPSINVYRIIPAWSGNEIAAMTVQQVQTIWLTAATETNGHDTTNVVYDAENDCLWSIGRQNDTSAPDYHVGRLFRYPMPTTLQDTSIDFTENWPLGIDVVNMQGVVKVGNNLIFGRGYYTVGYIQLIIVNVLTHQVTNVIDLMSQGFTAEPEGSLYYNGHYWLQSSQSYLYEFFF